MAAKERPPPLVKSIQQVCLKKPLGLRIAEQGDKIVVLEVKQAGGAATWNATQEYQIMAGDELVAMYQDGQRISAVGKTQEDIVGLVAAHSEPELKMELKHPASDEPIEEVSVLDKELTYLIELPKPLGLTIGADHNRLVVLDIEEEGAAARWNEKVEATSDFSRQIRVGDRLVAYFQDGARVSIQRESYSGVVSHLKNHVGDTIDIELIHASKDPNRPLSAYLKGFRQFVSKATFRLQQKLTLGPEMDSFFVDLSKPMGMTVGAVQDRIVVTKIQPKGNVAEWNELMALAVDGRHPNIRNQIREGDQIVGVYDTKGVKVDLDLNYNTFVNYVQNQKQGKMTFQMMHLPPGLLRPPTKWKSLGHHSHMRSIAWREYLGFVEKEEGEEATLFKNMLTKQRQEYVRLQKKYHVLSDGEMEQMHKKFDVNPLETSVTEAWRSMTDNKAILETLRKDISRTFSELTFFQKQETQEMLERILFVWYKEQESQSAYQQGMHELLAVVIIVLLKDIHRTRAESVETKSVDEVHEVNDAAANQVPVQWVECVSRAYLEHDAYAIFSGLMNIVLPFYTGASWLQGQSEHQQPFLYFRVQHIHYVLLQRYDPELFDHLEAAMVLPHLFLIRWLRLLFTREFNIEQSFIIWDVLLQSKGMELADYVCVAMLSFIRDQLLAEDAAHCLTKVFHYPQLSNEDVTEVLRVAKALHDGEMLKFSKKGVLLFANKSPQAKPSGDSTEALLKRLVEQEEKAASEAIRDMDLDESSSNPFEEEKSGGNPFGEEEEKGSSNPFGEEEEEKGTAAGNNPFGEAEKAHPLAKAGSSVEKAEPVAQRSISSISPVQEQTKEPVAVAASKPPVAVEEEEEKELPTPAASTATVASPAAAATTDYEEDVSNAADEEPQAATKEEDNNNTSPSNNNPFGEEENDEDESQDKNNAQQSGGGNPFGESEEAPAKEGGEGEEQSAESSSPVQASGNPFEDEGDAEAAVTMHTN